MKKQLYALMMLVAGMAAASLNAVPEMVNDVRFPAWYMKQGMEAQVMSPCGACKYTAPTPPARLRHIYNAHTTRKPSRQAYTCNYSGCGATFKTNEKLISHIGKMHGKVPHRVGTRRPRVKKSGCGCG